MLIEIPFVSPKTRNFKSCIGYEVLIDPILLLQELKNDPLGIFTAPTKLQSNLQLASAYSAVCTARSNDAALQRQKKCMNMAFREPKVYSHPTLCSLTFSSWGKYTNFTLLPSPRRISNKSGWLKLTAWKWYGWCWVMMWTRGLFADFADLKAWLKSPQKASKWSGEQWFKGQKILIKC